MSTIRQHVHVITTVLLLPHVCVSCNVSYGIDT